MFKRLILAVTVAAAVAIGAGTPKMASADWGHHHHHGYGHSHGHHHWHGHWHHRPIVYPPIVIGGYYPARYYVGYPVYDYYAAPYGYYDTGVQFSVGW
jgi:hypothetical protein